MFYHISILLCLARETHSAENTTVAESPFPDHLGVPFIGRERDIASIKQNLLPESGVSVVGLFGCTGSGKSRTAQEAASQFQMEHPCTKVCLIDIQQCLEEASWAQHFFEKLTGYPPKSTANSADNFRQWIKMNDNNYVLIVDNCESVVNELATFKEFIATIVLNSRGRIKCILTSQRRFRIRKQGIVMRILPWETLQPSDASKLFFQIAGNVCTEEEAQHVCNICGNIPLTVNAAASLVGSHRIRCVDLIKKLQNEEEKLASVLEFDDGDVSLMQILKMSFERWSLHEQKQFVKLSVFSGSFSKELADAVLGQDSSETIWGLPCIQAKPQSNWYELHRVFREFGHSLASDPQTASVFHPVFQEASMSLLGACAELVKNLSEQFAKDASTVKEEFSATSHIIKQFVREATNCISTGFQHQYISAALYCPFLFDIFINTEERLAFYKSCVKAASSVYSEVDECQVRFWLVHDLISEGSLCEAQSCLDVAKKIFDCLSCEQKKNLEGLYYYTLCLQANRGDRSNVSIGNSCYLQAVSAFVKRDPVELHPNVILPGFICGSLGIRTLVECSSVYSRGEDPTTRSKSVQFARIGHRLCCTLKKPRNHPDYLLSQNSFAIAQMACCNYGDAEKTFMDILKAQEELTDNHRDFAILCANVGQCQAFRGNYLDAGKNFEKSYNMLKELNGDEHKETLRSRFELAVNCQNNHEIETALEHFCGIQDTVRSMDETNRPALDFDLTVVEKQIDVLQGQDQPGSKDWLSLFNGDL